MQTTADDDNQYSLAKILTIWTLIAVPMPFLAFVVAPIWAKTNGLDYGVTIWLMLIAGMSWQFILSMIILYRELDEFTWTNIKSRIWLTKPTNPKTGKASYQYFWWLIPAFGVYAAFELTPVAETIGHLILIPLPFLADLPKLSLETFAQPQFVGAWWLHGIAILSSIFNYFLGEELLFRGILLPRMQGAFGKWDWAANAVLFALYHLHKPTLMIGYIPGSMAWVLPARYFRSIWFTIILHGIEGIFLFVMVFPIVSGRMF